MNPLSFLAGNGFTFDANSNTTTPFPLWITHWIQSIVSRIWEWHRCLQRSLPIHI